MLYSKEAQSIALGIAMLIVWTAATIHVQSRPQGQILASSQMDILPVMRSPKIMASSLMTDMGQDRQNSK